MIKKNKILTITPNPALDVSGFVDRIVPNEKTYVRGEIHAPGGNAINVARILNRLDVPVVASGFLGGTTGEEVASLLRAEHLHQQFIKIAEPTRMNITVSNQSDHKQTRLSFPGPHIARQEKAQMFKAVKNCRGVSTLVIGGSLPPNFSIQDLRKIITIAQHKNISVVVDCPGSVLKHLDSSKLLLIKPNLEEFHAMSGRRARSIVAVKKQALRLLEMASYVCISSVQGGALLVTNSGCFFGKIAPIKVKSTVGAGDSMVAAMVAQLHLGNISGAEILRWGLAAAAATLSETGTTLGSASQIRTLYKRTVVVEV